jgi:hypothetical protein
VLSYPFGTVDVGPLESDPGQAVPCPAGTFPTGGDAFAFDSTSGDLVPGVITGDGIDFDTAGTPDGYFAGWNNTSTTDTVTVEVDAVCANASTVQSKAKAARLHDSHLR